MVFLSTSLPPVLTIVGAVPSSPAAYAAKVGLANTMPSISEMHIVRPSISANIFDLFALLCVIIVSPFNFCGDMFRVAMRLEDSPIVLKGYPERGDNTAVRNQIGAFYGALLMSVQNEGSVSVVATTTTYRRRTSVPGNVFFFVNIHRRARNLAKSDACRFLAGSSAFTSLLNPYAVVVISLKDSKKILSSVSLHWAAYLFSPGLFCEL